MGNTDKYDEKLGNTDELERIFQIYLRVQSGDKSALNELFRTIDSKQICKADEINKEYRMSHMDNVLDSELVIDNEKSKQEEDWVNSSDSRVTFQFSCLNKMLYKKKKKFLTKAKNTGYENGQKIKNNSCSKFYEGEYDISDFNELIYHTIIEIFVAKTDENNCLTLDGKKNEKYPICDGVNLLKNISYFTSRKINKRAESSYLDIFDMGYCCEDSGADFSSFDKYAFKKFIESGRGSSRLAIYAEYLEWLKKHDIHRLFKANASDIQAIINTILNNDDVFMKDMSGDKEIGFGMRLVTQEMLREIIRTMHNINIEQENISKDLEIIEQRMLDHLFYSLNYRIDKAKESKGIYEKESERFLYELDEKKYIKVFGRTSYEIYDKSSRYINSDFSSIYFKSYFSTVKKYEDMIIDIVSLKKGKKKYDMVNLILNDDLVGDKEEALYNIADTIISYYQKREEEFRKNQLEDYKIKGFADWRNKYWEAELRDEILKIKLRSSRDVKKPVQHSMNRENLIVYCGYADFYFCDTKGKVCYIVPKNKRVVSRSNKNHQISIDDVG